VSNAGSTAFTPPTTVALVSFAVDTYDAVAASAAP